MTDPTCPGCFTKFVKRVRRESLQERVLSLIYIYPFRCQLCGRYFRFLHWKVKYRRVDQDRRIYQRLPISFPATLTGNSIESKGLVANISMAGCAINTGAKLEPGAILRMSLHIPGNLPPIGVQAAVVRDVQQNCAGLEFLQIEKTDRERLRAFISVLLREQWKSEDDRR